MKLTLKN